ncbi:hypothetical protein [Streptomyces sp. NBC_00443]|uniref:hypothetical protein n=1 Tax=Streptomyces sp. NBC_00443 TaxID=2975743 RepID=UPI002E1ADF8F
MKPAAPDEWDDLIDTWDEIRQGYYLGDAPEAVLDCARNLEASVRAGSPDTALWTLGLVLTGPYVIYARPDAAAEARVLEAMGAVEQALGGATCAHDEHPCDDMALDDELDSLRDVLDMLARPEWDAARDIWACPRNLVGFARAFADA